MALIVPSELHIDAQDKIIRKCLRFYSVLSDPRQGSGARLQVQKIHDFLLATDKTLRSKHGFSWRTEWEQSLGVPVRKGISKEWFLGRASIPIVAMQRLERFGIQDDFLNDLNPVYISTTTAPPIGLPRELSPDLVYLIGLILGDGSLPVKYLAKQQNNMFSVLIISKDQDFLQQKILPLFQQLFEIKKYAIRKDTRSNAFTLTINNKPIYRFFSCCIGMPTGKKAKNACVPQIIKELSLSAQIPFLAGLIDSDIGKHSSGLGATFSSKRFVDELVALLAPLGINAKNYGTHYKNATYEQNDFVIPKSQVKKLKDLLWQEYMPKRKDRLDAIEFLAGVR
ncbi:MAG: hypothetical protein Q7R47_06595 [Candidatus Diapherotrites archaeon]|nr:hypothetical protein [Candidatus Diapherotrites archaeon]